MQIQLSGSVSDQLAELIVQRVKAAVRLRVGVNPAGTNHETFLPGRFLADIFHPETFRRKFLWTLSD